MSATKRGALCALILAVLIATASGCSGVPEKHEKQVFAMDTFMLLTAYGKNAGEALSPAAEEIRRLEAALDPEAPGSQVAELNSGGELDRDSDAARLLLSAIEVFERSAGAFNPAIYPIYKVWGFVGQKYRLPDSSEIEPLLPRELLSQIDTAGETISLPAGCELTFGASAKGYAAERVIGILSERGAEAAIIDLGGDVMTMGQKPQGGDWIVSITDPRSPGSGLGTLAMGEGAVFTSGDYWRYFEVDGISYHHIFDPRTGYPVDNGLISVTVVCGDAVLADELSTALFVLGEDGALDYRERYGGFELVLITDDGRVIVTPGLGESFSPGDADYEYIIMRE